MLQSILPENNRLNILFAFGCRNTNSSKILLKVLLVFEKPLAVSVIVPVHNGGIKFKTCLDSLEKCSPSPCEIIVVADGWSDGKWRLAKERGHCTIISERQRGPAHARNLGAAVAKGDILLFIDADVQVGSDIILRIQSLFSLEPGLSAVIGSYDDMPVEAGLVSQYRNLLHHFIHQSSREDASTFWGACGAIRKSVFVTLGGFDSQYQLPSVEDIELGYRMKQKGYAIRLQKDIQVTHLKKWSLASMLRTDIFNRAIPWSKLLLKQGNIVRDLNLSFMARLSTVLVFLLTLSLLALSFSPGYIVASLICCMLLLAINRPFYFFLLQRRGMVFMLQSLPLHWLYFLYSGISFIYVFANVTVLRR
jgi:GT2 family glycosyltransferase